MNSEAKPRVYDILAKAFTQEDVRTCFALLGDANMNWAARLSEQGCRMVYVRHEHCAVAAAMAYARKTRDVGVATVTCGPGVTQVITALPAAVRAHLPLVLFAGEAPLKAAGTTRRSIRRRSSPLQVPPITARAGGQRSYQGIADGDQVRFERSGVRESIRATNSAETGMKWLADKTNCLTVRPGEGYCRN